MEQKKTFNYSACPGSASCDTCGPGLESYPRSASRCNSTETCLLRTTCQLGLVRSDYVSLALSTGDPETGVDTSLCYKIDTNVTGYVEDSRVSVTGFRLTWALKCYDAPNIDILLNRDKDGNIYELL